MDKCGQATGYDHTDLGGFVVSFLVFIFASRPTSIVVLKCLFCVYLSTESDSCGQYKTTYTNYFRNSIRHSITIAMAICN